MERLIPSVSEKRRLLHTASEMGSIANATSECRKAFQKYLKEPYPGTESDVARLFVNFERWSASLSVDRNWPSPDLRRILSLDTLLSTDAMTKRKLTDLLLLIAKHIRQASEASVQSRTSRVSEKSKGGSHSGYSDGFSESTFESFNTFVTQTGYINPLKAMKLYMKRLYDFSTLLRATVPEIRYLAPHHEKDESFWQVANIMVNYKFPDADPEITSRLAAAMILRRGRLMQLLTRRSPERRAHANTGSETKKGEEPEPAELAAYRAPTSAATVISAGFNTRKLSRVTPSIVSNPVKALDPWELIPSQPKTSETGGFTCRYCHRTLQPMSALRWRRHVLQDIEPLVCLHAACSRPLEMFGDYSVWKSHMQTHDLRWYCRAPCHGGSTLVFYHPADFEQHLCTVHRDTVTKSQIPLLIRNSSRPTSYMPDTCPLCLRTVDNPTTEWKSHILNHLMTLALLSADSVINMDQEDGDVASESISFSAWDSYQMSILDDEDSDLLFDDPVNADNGYQDAVMGSWPNVEDEWGFIKGQFISSLDDCY